MTTRRTDAQWLGAKSEPEQRLWEAYPHGTLVEYRHGEQIRAEVVAALALGAVPAVAGRTAGVRVRGARIVGELDLRHGTVPGPLTMLGCTFTDPLRMEEAETRSLDLSGSRLAGLRATGAHVRGSVNLNNARIEGGDLAAHLQLLTVDTDFGAAGLHCRGRLNLIGSNIGAVLDLNGAQLDNPGGLALNLGGAVVHRSVYCTRARIRGHLRMPGLTVGGVLALTGSVLTDPPQDGPYLNQSLSGDSLSTGGDALFDAGFTAAAQVDLSGAVFGGKVLFKGAEVTAVDRHPALSLAGASVRRGLYIGDGFRANGSVRLTGIQISGHLDLHKMREGSGPIQLYQARAATVRDGKLDGGRVVGGVASWPETVLLDGFSYDAFDPYLPAQERIKLLRRQPEYAAQPYEFMAGYFRALGHDAAAREILIEKERVRHRDFHRLSRLGSVISGTALGYGYLPRRAAFLALAIQVAASVFYAFAVPTAIHPGDRIAYDPVLYAADLFVPIVHFNQSDAFQSHGFAACVAFALPYLGWALGVAIVAGASRALSKGGGGIV